MLIFVSGLPKAGKSITVNALQRRMAAAGRSFFVQRLSPDCEGHWTTESGRMDLARSEKNGLKAAGQFFTPAQISFWVNSLVSLSGKFEAVFGDMGGIPSPENEAMVRAVAGKVPSIRAVVMVRRGDSPAAWVDFWRRLRIEPQVVETAIDAGNWQGEAEAAASRILEAIQL